VRPEPRRARAGDEGARRARLARLHSRVARGARGRSLAGAERSGQGAGRDGGDRDHDAARGAGEQPARGEEARGARRMSVPPIVRQIVEAWSNLFALYTCALGLHYAGLLYFGLLETLRLVRGVPWQETRRRMQSPLTPPISLFVPAHNEESGVCDT